MRSPQLLLKIHDLRPQKQRGQNFLVGPATAQMIVERAQVQPEDIVVEIGPGLGALTLPLARAAQAIIAIEKDRNLAKILCEELRAAGMDNVQVITADVLQLLAGDFVSRLAAGGALVLSGMLADLQSDEVGAVYEALGCRRAASRVEGEWEALLLVR